MNVDQLREKLSQLHEELERTEAVDDNTRELLADLGKDIQEVLNREGEGGDVYGSLTHRLRANLVQFETTHPLLTAAMERAIDALVQMGV